MWCFCYQCDREIWGLPEGWLTERWLQARCFEFVESERFRRIILAIILVNVGFLASYSYGQSSTWTLALNSVDAAFTIIYIFEVLLKWQAAGSLWYPSPGIPPPRIWSVAPLSSQIWAFYFAQRPLHRMTVVLRFR